MSAKAIECVEALIKKAEGREPLFFLDYDGTLTPIVPHPKDALLRDEGRTVVKALASRFFTAIVSGRGLSDIKELVGIKDIYFAGSHGFLLEGPKGEVFIYPEALPYREKIDEAFHYLQEKLSDIPGIYLEHKEFSVAVHFRQVNEGLERIKKGVDEAVVLFKGLKVTYGAMIFELRPDIEWNKGKAILWLIENASSRKLPPFPIVIGDDRTDEDAFMAVKSVGASIFVQGAYEDTNADYVLSSPEEVYVF